MSNVLAIGRQQLHTALSEVFPGRVSQYPPDRVARVSAPYVWIEQATLDRIPIGERSQGVLVTFPVWVIYDGAVRAQVAGLDQLTAGLWDAALRVKNASPRGARGDTYSTGDAELRATVIDVEMTLTALAFCPPDAPSIVVIPPEPVTV